MIVNISLCQERNFSQRRCLNFKPSDITDGKYLNIEYPGHLWLRIHKGAQGDIWPTSFAPQMVNFSDAEELMG